MIDAEIAARCGGESIGPTAAVRERYDGISAERHLRHPAVVAVSQTARSHLLRARPEPPRGPSAGPTGPATTPDP